MKILLIITSSFIIVTTSWTQIEPVVSGGSSLLVGTFTHGHRFLELQAGGGIRIKDQLVTQLNYKFVTAGFNLAPSNYVPLKSHLLMLSGMYRVLKKRYLCSPAFSLDVGVPVFSNGNSSLIHDNGYAVEENYSIGFWRYNRGLFFGKFKLMSDLKVKSFNILLGASYNLWLENVSWLKPGTSIGLEYYAYQTKVVDRHNFGIEAGIMYTFPGKKDKQ